MTPFEPDFETLAEDYARYRSSYSPALFDAVVGYARAGAGARALDIACGTGLASIELARRGLDVIGVDVAPAMLAAAREAAPPEAAVRFIEARAEALPFASGSFELVTCAQAFHWFDQPTALAQCARVLTDDGALAIWWKHPVESDPFTAATIDLVRELAGVERASMARERPSGSFEAFDQAVDASLLRDAFRTVLAFDVPFTVETFVGMQRSRESLRVALGTQRDLFFAELPQRLKLLAPSGAFVVHHDEHLYMARRR